MKIGYTLSKIAQVIGAEKEESSTQKIDLVYYDTRKIFNAQAALFFCLKNGHRDGHQFVAEAYAKGMRCFVVSENVAENNFPDAHFLKVNDTLFALQELAQYHREQFSYPVIGITGSTGKTTVKDWLYELLHHEFKIVRSPKSYNSQLGVALSLLEMTSEHNLAIIEAGISCPGEMQRLAEMIQPNIGILTNIGTAHLENFTSKSALLAEKLRLFSTAKIVFLGDNIHSLQATFGEKYRFAGIKIDHEKLLPWTSTYLGNLQLTADVYQFLTQRKVSESQLNTLPQLAARMEVFDGINENVIINDAYNLDLEALRQSLDFLVNSNQKSLKVVLIVADYLSEEKKQEVLGILANYPLDEVEFIADESAFDTTKISDSTILIKGYHNEGGQRLAQRFKLQKHETIIEIDLDAIRSNLNFYRSRIQPSTKMLVMVKANAYGSGALKMAAFLERNGIDYLGVAYGDEGVALRQSGIKLPILVMNAEPYSYEEIIENQLEPAIFSLKSLEEFIKTLIGLGIENYPIHLKLDTGMHRLGFNPDEIQEVLEILQSQPEVKVRGVYSHLADADNFESDEYSFYQLQLFNQIVTQLRANLPYDFIAHILNSEGILKFAKDYQYEMVRLGIGAYGYASNPAFSDNFSPAISWKTIISQVRHLEAGARISYNGKFTTQRPSKIATLPVGYADGLKRLYGYSIGNVAINGVLCPIVGTICMDMCMVDVTDVECQAGDEVEIFGKNIRLLEVAEKMRTITYEILTSISLRVHRIYLNE